MTMKKEGIQSRNRKISTKSKKRRKNGGGGSGSGSGSDVDTSPEPGCQTGAAVYGRSLFNLTSLHASSMPTYMHAGSTRCGGGSRGLLNTGGPCAGPVHPGVMHGSQSHRGCYENGGATAGFGSSFPFAAGNGGLASPYTASGTFSSFANSGHQNFNGYTSGLIGAMV